MVNFLSLFCPKLQRLLKPIYYLTRKGRQFTWGEEQQIAFDEIKRRLITPPVLHIKVDFIYIQTEISLLQVVLYIKFKMESPS